VTHSVDPATGLYTGMDKFLAALQAAADDAGRDEMTIDQVRQAAVAVRRPWNAQGPKAHQITDLDLDVSGGTLKARLYRPNAEPDLPVLFYLHGGGWVLLGLETHDRMMREYADASGWAVVGLDYPLAPETSYPLTIEACRQAFGAMAEKCRDLGLQNRCMAIGGDSAGANLAAALALALRDEADRGGQAPRGLVLNYGVYDCDKERPSYQAFSRDPFLLTEEKMSWFWECYCPEATRRTEPLASPLRADLSGLPPAFLTVAEKDILADENIAFGEALARAGNPVIVERYAHAPHAFLEALTFSPIARLAIGKAAIWLRGLHDTFQTEDAND